MELNPAGTALKRRQQISNLSRRGRSRPSSGSSRFLRSAHPAASRRGAFPHPGVRTGHQRLIVEKILNENALAAALRPAVR